MQNMPFFCILWAFFDCLWDKKRIIGWLSINSLLSIHCTRRIYYFLFINLKFLLEIVNNLITSLQIFSFFAINIFNLTILPSNHFQLNALNRFITFNYIFLNNFSFLAHLFAINYTIFFNLFLTKRRIVNIKRLCFKGYIFQLLFLLSFLIKICIDFGRIRLLKWAILFTST